MIRKLLLLLSPPSLLLLFIYAFIFCGYSAIASKVPHQCIKQRSASGDVDKRHDVIAIGNAVRDHMYLFDSNEDAEKALLYAVAHKDNAPDILSRTSSKAWDDAGGVAANTVADIALLGGDATFLYSTSSDKESSFFQNHMRKMHVNAIPHFSKDSYICDIDIVVRRGGSSEIIVRDGCSDKIADSALNWNNIKNYRMFVIEGYLLSDEGFQQQIIPLVEKVRQHEVEVVLLAGNSASVTKNKAAYLKLLPHVDYLAGSEDAILALDDSRDEDPTIEDVAISMMKDVGVLIAIRSNNTALVVEKAGAEDLCGSASHDAFHCMNHQINLIYIAHSSMYDLLDDTGSRDAFVAGFLYGRLRGLSVTESSHLGNKYNTYISKRFGTKAHDNLYQEVCYKKK